MLQNLAQCQALTGTFAANAAHAYRRLTLSKKLLLWIVVVFISILILQPHRALLRETYHPSSSWPLRHGPPRRPSLSPANKKTWGERREIIKEAFRHGYGGYERFAFGRDELRPLSNTSVNNLNGWGLTIVDSLDTMLLMGLDEEFEKGMEFVHALDFKAKAQGVGFFETIIRYVGGLLSAYYMTSISPKAHYQEKYPPVLLQKVDELSEMLQSAFNTSSGLPATGIHISSNREVDNPSSYGQTALAEMASCQMEFKYLAHLTGKDYYYRNADLVWDFMEAEQGKTPISATVQRPDGSRKEELLTDQETGLWNIHWYLSDGKMFGNKMSAGAMADSAYEYLLKQYLMSGRTEERLLRMYLKAMEGMINHLMYLSRDRNLLFVTDIGNWGTPSGNMEHLSCYLPGVLALGARLLDPEYPWTNRRSSRIYPRAPVPTIDLRATLDLHMRAATGLAHTCWVMYDEMESGIGPEILHFNPPDTEEHVQTRHAWDSLKWGPKVAAWERGGRVGPLVGTEGWHMEKPKEREYRVLDSRYILRPEAIEAMYLMWKTTGDPIWRERGWKMFKAINERTRTPSGYANQRYIDTNNPKRTDGMPSFFLAETLKYAYLNALDDDPLPLDQIVFNTEAHPFPIFNWTPEQMRQWGLH